MHISHANGRFQNAASATSDADLLNSIWEELDQEADSYPQKRMKPIREEHANPFVERPDRMRPYTQPASAPYTRPAKAVLTWEQIVRISCCYSIGFNGLTIDADSCI